MHSSSSISSLGSTLNASRPRRSSMAAPLNTHVPPPVAQLPRVPARRKRTSLGLRHFDILEDVIAEDPASECAVSGLTTYSAPHIALGASGKGESPKRARTGSCSARTQSSLTTHTMAPITEHTSLTATAHIRREPRRRTIFIPSDDTTLLTIHPGTKERTDLTTNLAATARDQGVAMPGDVATDTAVPRRHRPARTSILAAPKRAPLETSRARCQASTANGIDRNGSMTGKENVAPGSIQSTGHTMKSSNKLQFEDSEALKPRRTSIYARQESALLRKQVLSGVKSNLYQGSKLGRTSPSPDQPARHPPAQSSEICTVRQAAVQAKPRLDLRNYPPLQEDIAHARMFEDSWLSDQERVLVELVNDIFARCNKTSKPPARSAMRKKLLQLYQDQPTLRLYQRLQASLQFGTLSVAKDSEGASEAHRYTRDVGRRERFIKLWLHTFTPTFLGAALEVVIGRHITAAESERISTRDLQTFIECFLLRNGDIQTPDNLRSDAERTAWSWRRTMQRTLMTIYLLDQAKESLSFQGNLFRAKAAHKTTSSFLLEACTILHPSERSIQQCLSHLGYKSTHEQQPFADYSWPITNLATDMRDGVRLARVVELLLPPWQPLHADAERRVSCESAGAVGEDEDGSGSAGGNARCTGFHITPHLRIPASTRTAMLANNELVLQAVRDSNGAGCLPEKVDAADLVDGHREKSLALLWALVGTSGLQRLVDWDDLKSESRIFAGTAASASALSAQSTLPKPDSEHRALLVEWTSLIAAKHGYQVTNLSSAFSDGRIFESIVDEYMPLIPSSGVCSSSTIVPASSSQTASLERKLQSLGCSHSFASVFGTSRILDQDFVYATLLFLAACLLSASRPERFRRATLKRLAADCATVVTTRLRLEDAALTLQRVWRAVLARRQVPRVPSHDAARQSDTSKGLPSDASIAPAEKNVLDQEVDVAFWMV